MKVRLQLTLYKMEVGTPAFSTVHPPRRVHRRKCRPFSKNAPVVFRTIHKLISHIDPELHEEQGDLTFSRYGITKAVGGKFDEFSN
jgi:hypothetical protein